MKKYLEIKLTSTSLSNLLTYLPNRVNESELSEIFKKDIDRIKESYKKYDYNEIKMTFETEYQYYDDKDFIIQYWGYRWETDDEYNKRIEQEEKRKQAAKKATITKKEANIKREKTLLNTLLKKYKNEI